MPEEPYESEPLRVAWLAGPATVHRWGALLEPLADALHRRGVHLMLCCPETSPVELLEMPGVDIRRYRQPWWRLGQSKARQSISGHLKDFDADVLHALEASLVPLAVAAGQQSDVACVASGYSLRDVSHIKRHRRELVTVLAASETIAASFGKDRKHRGVVEISRPAVEAIGPASTVPHADEICTILADAMGGHRETMYSLMEAYAELLKRDVGLALFILDAGRAERGIRRDARRLGISAEVTFVDPQPDLDCQEIIRGADIFFSAPSRGEMNLHTLQAMAAGVPVLAGEDPAADFLRAGETAMVCGEIDAAALTTAIGEMLSDQAGVRARAEAALGRLRELHDVQDHANALEGFYWDAIDRSEEAEAATGGA